MKAIIFLIALFAMLGVRTVYGGEIDEVLGEFDFSAFQKELDSLGIELSFRELMEKMLSGEETGIAEIFTYIIRAAFSEVLVGSEALRVVLILAVISGILKAIMAADFSSEVSYACETAITTVIIGTLFSAFSSAVDLLKGCTEASAELVRAALPIIIAFLSASGQATSAMVLCPIILAMLSFLLQIVEGLTIPLITFSAILSLVNLITEGELVSKLADLMKYLAKLSVRAVSFLFLSVISLRKLGLPLGDKLANKGLKLLIGSVPVVGDVFSGSVEGAIYLIGSIKNTACVVIVVLMAAASCVPIIKLFVLSVIYKVMAALVQPIASARVVDGIDAVGEIIGIILGVMFVCVSMLMLMVIIVMVSFI